MARRSTTRKRSKASKKRVANRKRAPARNDRAKKQKTAGARKKRTVAGGSATAGGMNFQAAVTAIAAIQLARGVALRWLDGVVEDIPAALYAETGGAGDDIKIQFRNDTVAEAQIKRGLAAGARLWEPLIGLSKAINTGKISYGVLVVSPTSSRTIRDQFARDIVRIGEGRTDNLSALAKQFVAKLSALAIPVAAVCDRLRIVTINALEYDAASIAAAHAELAHICRDEGKIRAAWDRLYRDAALLIENRGRRTAPTVLRILQSEGIELKAGPQLSPVALVEKLTRWTGDTAATFSILGAERPLEVDKSWIPLKVAVRENEASEAVGLVEALSQYHNSGNSDRRSRDVFDGETIGRFIRHTVVVAGPGMGKSVLQKKLARCYSAEGYAVLRVSLASIAIRMRSYGRSFAESMFELGLDGFDVPASEVVKAGIADWVLLFDGLDECGVDQESVAQGIHDYVAGHPHCRVVVTTRPVGYRSTLLRAWRHYEIVPLDSTNAKAHLGDLIADIAPVGSPLAGNARDIAGDALKSRNVESVVARSPLLLGMAAVILARGRTLGRSKAELYGRMFELIDHLPNTRNPEPPATPSVLHRFLNVLGWNMVANPTAQTTQLATLCVEVLSGELGIPPLGARELVDKCADYWQAAGTIERVRHGDQETLTFIHKTFGEFSAARFLVATEPSEQRLILATVLAEEAWVEVLTFAGSLGAADLVTSSFLSNLTNTTPGVALLNRALALAADAEPPPNVEIRQDLLKAAFSYLSFDRPSWGHSVGEALIGVAERFPTEVGPFAAVHLIGEHAWTRVASWTCAVISGPAFYSLDELIKQLEVIPTLADAGFRSTLGGFVEFGGGNLQILQRFIIAATEAILDRCPAEQADKILPPVVSQEKLYTWGGMQQMTELMRRKNKKYPLHTSALDRAWTSNIVGSKEYNAAQRVAYRKMLEALLNLSTASIEKSDEKDSTQLLHMSAFIHLIKFLESPLYDMWGWGQSYDVAAVQEVFRGIVGITPVDRTQLLSDAEKMLARLESLRDEDVFNIWHSVVAVDVPEFFEEKAKDLNLNYELLESALYHRSSWLVQLALYLYILAGDPSHVKSAVVRLLEKGNNLTLSAAAYLAEKLGTKQATDFACDRLKKPLVSGCEHLFHLLSRLKPRPDEAVLAAISNGLLTGDEDTAVAAATLANELENPSAVHLLPIIARGYDHWFKHEKPYPTAGGVIPKSPRGRLLLTRLKIEPPTVESLFNYAADPRSDVVDIATKAMVQALAESPEARASFTDAIMGSRPSPRLLREALQSQVPFAAPEVQSLCRLLEADDPRLRYAALGLLCEPYLAKERAVALAKLRLSDTELDIREGAHRALERLSAPLPLPVIHATPVGQA